MTLFQPNTVFRQCQLFVPILNSPHSHTHCPLSEAWRVILEWIDCSSNPAVKFLGSTTALSSEHVESEVWLELIVDSSNCTCANVQGIFASLVSSSSYIQSCLSEPRGMRPTWRKRLDCLRSWTSQTSSSTQLSAWLGKSHTEIATRYHRTVHPSLEVVLQTRQYIHRRFLLLPLAFAGQNGCFQGHRRCWLPEQSSSFP